MALLINNEVNFKGGLTLDSVYVRLRIVLEAPGDIMTIETNHYQSKDGFNRSRNNSPLIITAYQPWLNVSYNYSTDGDPIVFAHNAYYNYLTTDITHKEYELYEEDVYEMGEEGNPILDEEGNPIIKYEKGSVKNDEEGNPILIDVVQRARYYDASTIEIVDL